jgi:phospholipid-binding lipoprotein MlaA
MPLHSTERTAFHRRTLTALAIGLAALGSMLPSMAKAGVRARPIPKKTASEEGSEKSTSQASLSPETSARSVRDPLQPINRGTFALNNVLYRFVLRPIGKATAFILTKPGLQCLENALENVEAPVRIVGCLCQAKFKRAGQETGKLLVNSTVGVGGLFKVSDRIQSLRDVPKEDFGQALASWGVPSGPYVVLPMIGPSNIREIVGHGVDAVSNPATWLGDRSVRIMTRGIKTAVENPYYMDLYDAVTNSAVDPYVAAREGYMSRRKFEAAR